MKLGSTAITRREMLKGTGIVLGGLALPGVLEGCLTSTTTTSSGSIKIGSGGGSKPALALCISCAGRKQILGSRTQEEVRIVNELLGDVPAAGFYGYGEIARLAKDGISHYHNETFTTLLLGGRVGSA